MDEKEEVVRLSEPQPQPEWEHPECETYWDRNAACPDCVKVNEDEHER